MPTTKAKAANAWPTKRFFVQMLTRDIALDDAVLDLLDNCIDGVVRVARDQKPKDAAEPYKGYWADIKFSGAEFVIADNCGGIPRDIAENYAFRFGRPDEQKEGGLATVGIYGIGMKRSIFKFGKSALVTSRPKDGAFAVAIPDNWESTGDWSFPIEELADAKGPPGTTVHVMNLHPEVAAQFAKESPFDGTLNNSIALHYSVILGKGFEVRVNGKAVKPRPLMLLADVLDAEDEKPLLAPYIYRNEIGGVSVDLAVGFYKPIPTEKEVDEAEEARHTSDDAGWTIICNDRVVVACDKTMLTGWGEANVPSYHPQFIAIAGIVQFTSADPSLLPITTTKRGIEAGSPLYLQVKEHMRWGVKLFTSYTNKWKTQLEGEKKNRARAKPVHFSALVRSVPAGRWKKVRGGGAQERYFQPELPEPARGVEEKFIRFARPVKDISKVARFLFDDPDAPPSEVGAACFDATLKEAKKK